MDTLVFDLDGTLADTSVDLLAAANACFRRLGHGDMLDVRDTLTAFQGGRAMLRLGFSRLAGYEEEEIDAQYPILLEAYGQAIDTHTTLYPGALQAVTDLKAAGFGLAICTNKPEALAETLTNRLGIRHLFGALVGADTLPVRKPDPAPLFEAISRVGGIPSRAVLIGDTQTDRDTGRAAGIPVILVSFGPEGEGVSRLQPEAMLDDYADLSQLVERLLRTIEK